MKKITIGLLALLSLAACGSASGGSGDTTAPDTSSVNDNSWFYIHHVPVDGKTVTCLEYNGHGLSCDWANSK
jgi:ABC-type glycerol-3-phosphate transport system substrate-binding protein